MSDCGDDMCCSDDGVCDAGDYDSDGWYDCDSGEVYESRASSKETLVRQNNADDERARRVKKEVEVLQRLVSLAMKSGEPLTIESVRGLDHAEQMVQERRAELVETEARLVKNRERVAEMERCDACLKRIMFPLLTILLVCFYLYPKLALK